MVFIVNRNKLIMKGKYHKNIFLDQSLNKNNIQDQERPLDPIVKENEKDTTIQDLEQSGMIGEGFRVMGAGSQKLSYKPKNEKLRKFISLKL
jgi:hypothetical protein